MQLAEDIKRLALSFVRIFPERAFVGIEAQPDINLAVEAAFKA